MFVLDPGPSLDKLLISPFAVIIQTGLVTSVVVIIAFSLWIIIVGLLVLHSLINYSILNSGSIHTGLPYVLLHLFINERMILILCVDILFLTCLYPRYIPTRYCACLTQVSPYAKLTDAIRTIK